MGFYPGCSNPECICHTPRDVCEKFDEMIDDYCQCGWQKHNHQGETP